jgi:hypothetical protein
VGCDGLQGSSLREEDELAVPTARQVHTIIELQQGSDTRRERVEQPFVVNQGVFGQYHLLLAKMAKSFKVWRDWRSWLVTVQNFRVIELAAIEQRQMQLEFTLELLLFMLDACNQITEQACIGCLHLLGILEMSGHPLD